jgi:hypothetical protein
MKPLTVFQIRCPRAQRPRAPLAGAAAGRGRPGHSGGTTTVPVDRLAVATWCWSAPAALDRLDDQTRRDLVEAWVVTSIYESALKDGFGALETYVKNRFQQEAKNLTKPPATTTFQRLQDTNELYQQHLGVELEAAVGAQVWAALLQAAAIRHVLTHNAGVIDAKFLTRVTGWPQRQEERLQVRRADADRFLDVLEQFAAAVL